MFSSTSLYGIDPRVKVIWLVSSTSVYFTNNIFLILLVLIISGIAFFLSKSYKTLYVKGFYYVLAFFSFVFIFVMLTSGQKSDVLFVLVSILKWSAVILTSIAFFVITRPFEVMQALRGLKVPEGFVFALGISFRFIPVLLEEIEKITLAQKARGLYYGKGVKKIFRLPTIIKSLTIPLIVETLRKTWDVWLALNVRGFGLGKKRKNPRFKPSILNFAFLLYSICIIVFSLILEV